MTLAQAWHRLSILPFLTAIYVYKVTLSPFLGGQCRFVPTCSTYALDAYREHGVVRGTVLTARRIARCNPLSAGGYDPVPLRTVIEELPPHAPIPPPGPPGRGPG